MSELIDYAKPMLIIEDRLKVVHEHCLRGDWPAAQEQATQMVADVRLLVLTLYHLTEGASNANTQELSDKRTHVQRYLEAASKSRDSGSV